MALGRNGGIIGKDNTPTSSNASGVWTLNEVADCVRADRWPGTKVTRTYINSFSDTSTSGPYEETGINMAAAPAQSDRIIVIALGYREGGGQTVSDVEIDSGGGYVSATEQVAQSDGGNGEASIWSDIHATGSTISVRITTSGSAQGGVGFGVYAVYGAGATETADVTDTSLADPGDLSVTVANGGVLIACAEWTNNSAHTLSWTGDVVKDGTDQDVGSSDIFSTASVEITSGGTKTAAVDSTDTTPQRTPSVCAVWNP